MLLCANHDVNICRHERILSDIVADQGRPVRMRYCSDGDYPAKEEELTAELNISQAINILTGIHSTAHRYVELCCTGLTGDVHTNNTEGFDSDT